jgi:hypothetical protein
MAEVETPNCLATSAKAIPRVFTNPTATRERTALICLRRLPPFSSSFEISDPSDDDVDYTKLHNPSAIDAQNRKEQFQNCAKEYAHDF